MNDEQLDRCLKSIGKTCFVNYFELFTSSSRTEKIETLKKETSYTEKSCSSRTGHAQMIVRDGREGDALQLVIDSTSPIVTDETKNRAKELLLNLNRSFSTDCNNIYLIFTF